MKHELRDIFHPPATGLNVLVAYENLCHGIRALDFCNRLAERITSACELNLIFWSLSSLEIPVLARLAELEAAGTHLLLMTIDGANPLPPPVQIWLRHWARRRHARRVMLAVQVHGLDPGDEENSPAFACLQQIADDSGVDFLYEITAPAAEPLEDSLAAIHQRARLAAPVLGLIPRFDEKIKPEI